MFKFKLLFSGTSGRVGGERELALADVGFRRGHRPSSHARGQVLSAGQGL